MPKTALSADYVDVKVPQAFVGVVYTLLGRLMAEDAEDPGDGDASPRTYTSWGEDLVARAYRESPRQSMQPILRHLAEHSDEWVASSELLALLGLTDRSSLAGVFGAFGRRVKNRYGMESWPFEDKWNYEDGEQLYRMSQEVAAVIDREAALVA